MGEFIITGSQQFGLHASISQSLAGHAGRLELLPFSLAELKRARRLPRYLDDYLFKGSYPPVYDRAVSAYKWYVDYMSTYIERDFRQILRIRDLGAFQRFVRMCAARIGQLINLSALANDLGIAHVTVREWLQVLETGYVVFLLRPHFQNLGKRLVKTPKLYFYDTGLAAALLGIQDSTQLNIHPSRPALFENFAMAEFIKNRYNLGLPSNLYFWRDNIGNEVDLIIDEGKKLIPVEIKSGRTITSDFFKGLKRWVQYAGSLAGTPVLVYGGEAAFEREGINVINWRADFGKPVAPAKKQRGKSS